MKISICITLLNEEKSIALLLDSLLSQTRVADEIVIVDGGSRDKTREIVSKFKSKSKRIRLFVKEGNIAVGRNFGIRQAKGPIIALTDAGCVPKRDWLQKLTWPFARKDVELAAGFYEMLCQSDFHKALSVFIGVPGKRFNPTTFIPSARSVAFKKVLWQKIGGFDEKLASAGEDTLFFYKAVKLGVKIIRVKEARVMWKEIEHLNLFKAFRKFYLYAKGDAQTGIWWHPTKKILSHNVKILTIYLRYIIFSILFLFLFSFKSFIWLILFLLTVTIYFSWSIFKWRDVIGGKARFWLPVIQIVSDIAVMAGFFIGTIRR